MAEIVVADAGPLIALGRLHKLELLARIFEKVIVPAAVFEETQFRADLPDSQAIAGARRSGLFLVDESAIDFAILPPNANLGTGEAAAICVAAARGCGVLMDEKLGRAVAEELKLRVIGTVGVLLIVRLASDRPALGAIHGPPILRASRRCKRACSPARARMNRRQSGCQDQLPRTPADWSA